MRKVLVAKSVKMDNAEQLRQTLESYKKKLRRTRRKIDVLKAEHGDTPSLTHTYWGGWDIGYQKGISSTLEDIIDDLTETLELVEKLNRNQKDNELK